MWKVQGQIILQTVQNKTLADRIYKSFEGRGIWDLKREGILGRRDSQLGGVNSFLYSKVFKLKIQNLAQSKEDGNKKPDTREP